MESALEEVAVDAISAALAQAALLAQEEVTQVAARPLESVSIKRNQYIHASKMLYRVYDKPNHFVLVEAGSAHEAYAKSGVAEAVKIQREFFFTQIALDKEQMTPSEQPYNLSPELPSSKQKKLFVDLMEMDAELAAKQKKFEAVAYGDMYARPAAAVAAPEVVAEMPAMAAPIEEMPEPPMPQIEPVQAAPEPVAEEVSVAAPQEEVMQEEVMEVAPAPTEEVVAEPAQELTADEVNALLAGGDED